jgi:hypothetical protein
MLTVKVQSNASDIVAQLMSVAEQCTFATAVALTRTGQDVKAALRDEMSRVFDKPTPWTLNSMMLRPATKEVLRAKVWVKDVALAKWLLPEISGGSRSLKGFEKALISRGLMPSGCYAVPGAGAQLDSNGNMSPGQIMKLLSALGAAEIVSGFSANRTAASKKRRGAQLDQYFSIRTTRGRLRPGIYQRFASTRGSSIKPVLIFVPRVAYRARLDFYGVTQQVASERFPAHLARASQEFLPR